MYIDADRLFDSYHSYLKNVKDQTLLHRRFMIEGKVLKKQIMPRQPRKMSSPGLKSAIIVGRTVNLQPKACTKLDFMATYESLPLSNRSSRLSLDSARVVHSASLSRKEVKPRCQSAYPRFQIQKSQKTETNPSKIFSTVSLLFDQKNSMRHKNSKNMIQDVGNLKIRGVRPNIFPSTQRLY